ncbi:MAG: ATP-binding protein [Chloroflexi bacterium]|nr:ATP-binding protein [Chloroflexota bacterium]
MTVIKRALFPFLQRALADQRIIVITGMRRVGKTTTLRWLLDRVPSANKLYLDLERLDQRAVFAEANYDLVMDYLRNRGLDPTQPITLAIDEIQNVPNLPSVIKYLYDQYKIKFLLTGSSSFYLKNYFSESMAGRKVIFELFPLSFGEYLDFHAVPFRMRTELADMRYDTHEFERLKGHYDTFVTFGGMPDVALEQRPEAKQEILRDIITSYINIDVRTMADFTKINELQQLLRLLAMRIGSKLDISKLSQVLGISRPTVNAYLEFLEKTYVIERLGAFAGPDKTAALGRKLYFCDNGIASVLAQVSEGALFENALYNQLKHYGTLNYLAHGSTSEVDFVLNRPGQPPAGLEAKYHPVLADDTKLQRIAQRYDLDEAWLVGRYPTPAYDRYLWGGLVF